MHTENATVDHLQNFLVYRDGGTLRVRMAGPIDRDSTRAFQQRLEPLMADGRFSLHLDLGAADFLDSDGIRWLQRVQAAAQASSGEVRIAVRVGTRIDRTMTLLHLDKMFRVERYGTPVAVDVEAPAPRLVEA